MNREYKIIMHFPSTRVYRAIQEKLYFLIEREVPYADISSEEKDQMIVGNLTQDDIEMIMLWKHNKPAVKTQLLRITEIVEILTELPTV